MKKNRRVGIGFKINCGYILIILCLITSAVILNSQLSHLQQDRDSIIAYDSSMRTLSNELERQIISMESSLHRYLMTADSSYLDKYNEELKTWEAHYKKLKQIVHNYSDNEEQLIPIYEDIINWIDLFGRPLNEAILTGEAEAIRQAYNGEYSSTAMQHIQQKFSDFRDYETATIQEKINNLNNKTASLTYLLFFSLAILTIITVIIITFTSRKIVWSITAVTHAIQKMDPKDGNVLPKLKVRTNDEVRDLIEATNALLEKMEKRQWLQTNLTQIATAYQGVKTLPQLGTILLDTLIKNTGSVYGAFYVQESINPTKYSKIASFAEASSEIGRQEIEAGQGYIGQCIQQQQMFTYSNEDHVLHHLETSLGNIPIHHGVIVPVLLGKDVIAVLELASLKAYDEEQLELIKEVVVHLGVTINSILGHMEIIRLLNESQAMTEELQVQSEELQTQSEELKLQTEELTTINEQLEERTREAEQKTLQLEQAQKELQQSSNYKSEFLANMSHELRTPLNSILILSEMLAENPSSTLSEDELEYAKIIHNSGNDLLNLINDILDLSKVEAGKMDLWFSETDLYAIPQHIKDLFGPIAKQKQIALTIHVDQNITKIFYTDTKRFYQILNNMLSNALKFTEEGSVHVNITQPIVTDSMKDLSENWVKVSVSDTGIGISEEKLTIIFESFQQADGATVRKYGGTGLGLSICRELTWLLGGWIDVESTLGEGSTFTVYLPSLPEGNFVNHTLPHQDILLAETDDTATTSKNVFHNKRILLVDDDPRNIYALRHVLKQKGVEVLEASNGTECLQILQADDQIDAVLLDIMMPEMDGYEALAYIREELQMKDLPIIALTAKAMQQDRDRAFEAGASDYISKPLNLEQLFSLLTVWLTNEESMINGQKTIRN